MDPITGLLLLWGLSKARIGPGVVPALNHPSTPPWPAPATPPPARPLKRKPVRRVAKPARPTPRVVPRAAPAPMPAAPAPMPAAPAAPAAVEPAAAPPPVYTTMAVRDAQTILNALGAGLKVDNLFGPKTAGAWREAALSRDLPAHIVRQAPQVVQVTTYTLDRLRATSGGVAGLYIP